MIIDSFADDTNRLLLLAGHYPRGGGVIALSGWRGQLWHTGPGQIVVSIQPQHSKTVFNLKLWFSQYEFTDLRMTQLTGGNRGWCRVSLRRSATQPLMSRNLSLNAALLKVPVPDFTCIMRAFAIVYEVVPEPTAALSGRRVYRGSYVDGGWHVDMIETSAADGGGAVLLLRFKSRYIRTFTAQIFPYPKFHSMKIASRYDRDDGFKSAVVHLVAKLGSHEQVQHHVKAVRMVPLPCMSYVSDSFP